MAMSLNNDGMDSETYVSGSMGHRRPLVIAVEGNIGSGKSTFLSYCRERPHFEVQPEPVDKWTNLNGVNLLAKFYENRRRWAMPFQMFVNMTMLDIYQRDSVSQIKLIERSLLSSRYCFVEHLKRSGTLEPGMGFILDEWYQRAFIDYRSKPHAIIYFHTSSSVAHSRIVSRSRVGEATIGLNYLEDLHRLHDDWISRLQAANLRGDEDLPIHVIDADQPLEHVYSQYESCLEFINLLTL